MTTKYSDEEMEEQRVILTDLLNKSINNVYMDNLTEEEIKRTIAESVKINVQEYNDTEGKYELLFSSTPADDSMEFMGVSFNFERRIRH